MEFTTESGSTYEVRGMQVRRVNDAFGKRADGEWRTLHVFPVVQVGYPVTLVMDSLAPEGPDDLGSQDLATNVTVRMTSPVVEIRP